MAAHKSYSKLISLENLFQAWDEFKKGKRNKIDVQIFERNLEDNLLVLHEHLRDKTYRHGKYQAFYVHDPKKRHIHKASVQDRVVHHLLYKYLYGVFDRTFIYDSYSCRLEKGTHKGVLRLEKFTRIVSKNYTKKCWALKLDIKKFFANVDHEVLKALLRKKINDQDLLWLLEEIISSFCTCHPDSNVILSETKDIFFANAQNDSVHKGIPLGNLTSQVFANVYMNEVDQFVKHELKVKDYIRYADDFLILAFCSNDLNHCIKRVEQFIKEKLKLELHPNKIIFRKLEWGIDFLGYIVLPYYILPRTKTKRRLLKRLNEKNLQSYLGYLKHANTFKLQEEIASSRSLH